MFIRAYIRLTRGKWIKVRKQPSLSGDIYEIRHLPSRQSDLSLFAFSSAVHKWLIQDRACLVFSFHLSLTKTFYSHHLLKLL